MTFGIPSQARGATNEHRPTHTVRFPMLILGHLIDIHSRLPCLNPRLAVPVPEISLFGTPLHEHILGGLEQELSDIGQAVRLRLQKCNAVDAKKGHDNKARRSSPLWR
jgi:hypothetical protein